MKTSRSLILYIHGFNSSPASEKAQQLASYCQSVNADNAVTNKLETVLPQLSHDPEIALASLEDIVQQQGDGGQNILLLVGSSLGGYYATWLAEKYHCRAAVINPAVSPVKHLGEEFLGWQKNYYTDEEYEFTRDHALFLDTLDINPLRAPENILLLLQTGDQVLDYRLALERYAASEQIVQQGGSHRFEHFETMIGPMLEFARHGKILPATRAAITDSL